MSDDTWLIYSALIHDLDKVPLISAHVTIVREKRVYNDMIEGELVFGGPYTDAPREVQEKLSVLTMLSGDNHPVIDGVGRKQYLWLYELHLSKGLFNDTGSTSKEEGAWLAGSGGRIQLSSLNPWVRIKRDTGHCGLC